MYKKLVSSGLVVILLFVGLACGQAAQPTAVTQTPDKQATEAAAKPAWQQEWEKTLAAAKQEGVVSVGTIAGPGQTAALRDGFMKAYGINIEFTTAGMGAELIRKVLAERQAGLYLADVFISGAPSYFTDLKPVGALDPVKSQLLLPEVLDPKLWYGGSLPFIDLEEKYILATSFFPSAGIVVNSDLVKPEEIRTNKDLLDPKWKGKIVLLDPTTGGGGQEWSGMVTIILGADFMREFAKQELVVTRDARQQVEWIAKGKYPILVGVNQQAVAEFLTLGAPLRQVLPSDALYAIRGMTPALINKAAHPNATRVFLNWLFSKEGQTVNAKAFLQQSTRVDVATDFLPPLMVRQPGAVYTDGSREDIISKRNQASKEAMKILGLGQ